MDHVYISEHTIPERYAVGDLSDEQCAAFEEHLAGCPECAARVETAQDLRDGMRSVPRQKRSFRPLLAIAAVLVMAIAAGWFAWRFSTPKQELAKVETMPVYNLMLTRGAGEPANRVVLQKGVESILLAIDLSGLPPAAAYHARLESEDGQVVWPGADLKAVSQDAMGITIRSELLKPGTTMRLVIDAPGQRPVRFPFRVVQ